MHTGAKIAPVIPQTIDECYRLATLVCKSGMAPKDYKDNPEAACVTIMHGMEVGVPPMAALQGISNINGRPCIWGDLALALVRSSGLMESIEETIDGTGDNMVATCKTKRKGDPTVVVRTFSVADAKKAGLWTKTNTPWITYPQRMLQMRARAWCIRDAYTDVLKGLHIREEIEDIEPRDITPPRPEPTKIPPEPTPSYAQKEGREERQMDGAPLEGSLSPSASPRPEQSAPAPSNSTRVEPYPEIPAFLRRSAEVVDAEFVEETLFDERELSEYLSDLKARFDQAGTDLDVIEEIWSEHIGGSARKRMLPTDWPMAKRLYEEASQR
jgi:hypothetical protein